MTEELPPGWTITVEDRPWSAIEGATSAFADGKQCVVRDPAGERPAQAEWPTTWRRHAVNYARAVAARRAAEEAGEPVPLRGSAPANPSLLVAAAGVETVAPEDWNGLLHQRPGLCRRVRRQP